MKWILLALIVATVLCLLISTVNRARSNDEKNNAVALALHEKSVRALNATFVLALLALILSIAVSLMSKP